LTIFGHAAAPYRSHSAKSRAARGFRFLERQSALFLLAGAARFSRASGHIKNSARMARDNQVEKGWGI